MTQAAASLTLHEAQVLGWLGEQRDAMLALLEDVVDTDSGSYDKAGVDAVGAKFIAFLTAHGLLTEIEPNDRFGNAIHIRLDDRPSNERPVLLMGHRDTPRARPRAGRSASMARARMAPASPT